ncbi:hypothetical protein BGHDH14_bgh03043 [Blumeria hordei DH14]|uniref:Uncharacterized protein n=1 Tax=Blumeria graminis f. sp. hordei (strain DH14) TaxID=546991 RepID=N1J9V5_BLUG1|nr:hypothetical protein BGHDH14_bgh03043 [Blumeria hordei DH14]
MKITAQLYLLFVVPASSSYFSWFSSPFFDPPFQDPISLSNISSSKDEENILLKRDGNCPINYNSCSTLAAEFGGACCESGANFSSSTSSLCTTDGAHRVACCTIGAKCTGRLDKPSTTTEGAFFGNPAEEPTNTLSITTTSNGILTSPTSTGSVVVNAYFPFPYIPTTYADRTVCLSAYSACQTNYAACAANLQGSNYGVTIIAPAGGITMSPTAQNLGLSSATSICSSLSSKACYGIVSTNCNQFGQDHMAPTAANNVARQTMGAFATAGIIAGFGFGVAGQIV